MLNPETVLMKRSTGVRQRESLSGTISSRGKGDNPLLFTGAGSTTLELDLVFDTSIPGSSIVSQDVRDLTRPIWNLSENDQRNDRSYRPALCRFIWGKSWNFPGVISAMAEKLESFTPEGVPRRSWIRLELIRMLEQPHSSINEDNLWSDIDSQEIASFSNDLNLANIEFPNTESPLDFSEDIPETLENSFERVDITANRLKGHPSFWRDITLELNIENPLQWVKKQFQQINSSIKEKDSSQ